MSVQTQTHTAILRTITPQTRDVTTLRFGANLKFKPGQSIGLTFPRESKKRYYSISSAPVEGDFIEITVKAEIGSSLKEAIGLMQRGDKIDIEGPLGGSLALPEPVAEPLAFIAAGTGITPFRSMIRALLDTAPHALDYYLLHSVRSQQDLLFPDELRAWAEAHRNFHYIPTITKDYDDNWKNETGRISEALLRKHIAEKPCTYLLCGPAAFVNDMETLLKDNLQVAPDRIRREKW